MIYKWKKCASQFCRETTNIKHGYHYLIDQTNILEVPLLIRHCHLFMNGHLKLRLQLQYQITIPLQLQYQNKHCPNLIVLTAQKWQTTFTSRTRLMNKWRNDKHIRRFSNCLPIVLFSRTPCNIGVFSILFLLTY